MKPCSACGRPVENNVRRCPGCGERQKESVRLSPREESPAQGERRASGPTPGDPEWLKGEAVAAASVILQSILTTAALAAAGGTFGYLLFGVPGLIAGAILGSLWTLVGAVLSTRGA